MVARAIVEAAERRALQTARLIAELPARTHATEKPVQPYTN